MATTKIWKVDSHLRRVVDYAKNENKTINPDWEKSSYQAMEDVMNYAADDLKTEQKFYVSGINCVPERAREMMMQTKEQYQKRAVSSRGMGIRVLPKVKWMRLQHMRLALNSQRNCGPILR